MDEFLNYYSDSSLIKMLCKHRAGISHKRHKKHMTRDISLHQRTNKISISESDEEFELLQSIFPTRRNWKKLNQNERHHPSRFSNSIERNQHRLWKSYKYEKYLIERKGKLPENWYYKLLEFCKSIRDTVDEIDSNNYKIRKPDIFPLPKSAKGGKFVYRPIAKYSVVDKIITSAFSRYLTVKFDRIFLDCSYAFRARKDGKIPNHHDSITKILKHKKKFAKLWVAECDIQKFFDTVQHRHLEKIFFEGVKQLQELDENISPKAIRLFYLFLDSYSFNKDVLPKNLEPNYFKRNGVPAGEFGWVAKYLKTNFSIEYLDNFKIGVPQGNAVSCFIANLILSKIDEAVVKVHEDLLYVRYCDDMVIAHPDKSVCKDALEVFKKGISDNYLLYHETREFKDYRTSAKKFWSAKSKEPYYWGNKYVSNNNVPWLAFVGYQINYKGELRVRKSSINKEVKKQIKETQRILLALGMDRNRSLVDINKYSRKSKRQILFSLQQRLVSMSVGRATLYNYNKEGVNQGLCWTNGFSLLNNNKIVSRQLKELDKRREQQISYLKRMINHLTKTTDNPDSLPENMEEMYFGKPFSYYQYIGNF
ncbi:reverse transcriptase domain-containing protein [uncultured Croceitalea sp.]|uniref:reverse transcriptase domain-containing protein n=1 Tax=uncultured Croceitalea sp. TaxID=1798908 RepID=UPI00374EACCF